MRWGRSVGASWFEHNSCCCPGREPLGFNGAAVNYLVPAHPRTANSTRRRRARWRARCALRARPGGPGQAATPQYTARKDNGTALLLHDAAPHRNDVMAQQNGARTNLREDSFVFGFKNFNLQRGVLPRAST